MSRINIVNATAEDFAIEVLNSAPSGSSVGDHQNGRIVKYLTHMYLWCNHTGAWIKFPNVSDYQAFESDLNTQIAARQADLASLEAIDIGLQSDISTEESVLTSSIASLQDARSQAISSLEDARSTEHATLSSELSAQSSARVSSVDSAQARAEAAEAVVSTALVEAISERLSDVATEKLRAETAEAVISGALVTAITDREAGVSAEASRAVSVEGSISAAITSDSATLGTEITSVENSLNNQEATSSNEYSALNSVLAADAVLRSDAHDTIQSSIDGVDEQVSAMLFAAEADISTMSQVASYINSVDLAHDTQTSQEFSSLISATASAAIVREDEDSVLQSAIESAAAARSQQDSVLDSAISSAEAARLEEDSDLSTAITSATTARSQEDSNLNSSVASHIAARTAEYSTLESNIAAESVARDSEHATLSQALSSEVSTEASREGSLEILINSLEAALVAEDTALSLELSTQISNQGSANTNLDSNFASDLTAAAQARSQEDSVLTSAVASAAADRLEQDTAIQSVLDSAEAKQASETGSLTTRISTQEVDRSTAVAAHDADLSARIGERSQQDSVLAAAISVESARVTSMLADASIHDGQTLDTFVELVSFLTEVDTESDNALDAYVATIDASLNAANTSTIAIRDAQSQELSTQISARGSAIDSAQSRAESAEASLASNISAVESVETARHLRINFSSATSLTVGTSDLAGIGFTAGNGMVQVFQEVSSGTFRHLVAPSTFNPSTGEMTFDLGSTAKTGFAIFYSFAGDDQTSTSGGSGFEIPGSGTGNSTSNSSSVPQFQLTVSAYGSEQTAPAEIAETYAAAEFQNNVYIADRDNATVSVSSYEQTNYDTGETETVTNYNWELDTPFSGTYDTNPPYGFTPNLDWGAEGESGAVIRWYSQQSTDGGTTWSATSYSDTDVTIGSFGPSGTDNTSFPTTSPVAIPAQSPNVGDAFKVWAEGYDTSGTLIFQAGSESSPYYLLAHDYDHQFYSGSYYDSVSSTNEYWYAGGSTSVGSVFGQQRDITLTNPSSLTPGETGNSMIGAIANFQANASSDIYGWDSNTTTWTLTGTDAAEFDLTYTGDGNNSSQQSNTNFVSLYLKEPSGGGYAVDVPAAGTYTARLTASVPGKSDTIWDITMVIS